LCLPLCRADTIGGASDLTRAETHEFHTEEGETMAGKFEIKKAKNGEYYFHLKAGNGQIILTSEMYVQKASAKNGIESVKKHAPHDEHYERKPSKNGQHMFNLKAANHEVIGTSETYTTEEARNHGIESVKENAPRAEVEDETTAS
jgi:uncharacterized protein